MIRPELHRLVDRLHRPDPFVQRIDRLVDHRHQDAVDDEGREILGGGRGLAKAVYHRKAGFERLLVGRNAPDQLDELHHRDGVHEVEAHELFRPVRPARQPCDRNGRGVRGENRLRREMRPEACEDLLLDLFLLGRGLNDEVHRAKVCQGHRAADARQRRRLVLGRDLAAVHLTVDVAVDLRHGAGQRLGADVVDQHIISCQRKDMRDAGAHLPGPHDAHRPDIHGCPRFRNPADHTRGAGRGARPRRKCGGFGVICRFSHL